MKQGIILIGYDVETMMGGGQYPPPGAAKRFFGSNEGLRDVPDRFLRKAVEMHRASGIPATFFISGVTIEENLDLVKEIARDGLFEVSSHGYSHKPYKNVREMVNGEQRFSIDGESFEISIQELSEGRRTLDKLENPGRGIACPYAYQGGLHDLPEIRAAMLELGFRYTRSWGRDFNGCSPLPFDVQPFYYAGGLLEIPVCGWFDINWRFNNNGWNPENDCNNQAFLELMELQFAAGPAKGAVWSTGFHDWSTAYADPEMKAAGKIIELGKSNNIRFMTHRDFYQELN